MYYCEDCRTRNGWPESFSRSRGMCECCDAFGVCFDVPSSRLPNPRREPQTDSGRDLARHTMLVVKGFQASEVLVEHQANPCQQCVAASQAGIFLPLEVAGLLVCQEVKDAVKAYRLARESVRWLLAVPS